MVLGKKVTIFDWEWGRIQPLEMGRKGPGLYEQLKFHAQLSWAWNFFYNLGTCQMVTSLLTHIIKDEGRWNFSS